MKLTPKKKAAIWCIVWCILTLSHCFALWLTDRHVYGFFMLFSLIMFLYENNEFKRKWPRKNDNVENEG